MRRFKHTDDQLYDPPEPALHIINAHLGVKTAESRKLLRALISGGWAVVPREPSNTMLSAYIEAYGRRPQHHRSVIVGISKARKRWQAMMTQGLRMAMSAKKLKEEPEECATTSMNG